jgi:hypothetical protein
MSGTNVQPRSVATEVRRDPPRAPAGVAPNGLPSRALIPVLSLRTT